MPADELVKATAAGLTDELLAGHDPGWTPDEPFVNPDPADQGARGKQYKNMREYLRDQSPEKIVELHKSGALDDLLSGRVV